MQRSLIKTSLLSHQSHPIFSTHLPYPPTQIPAAAPPPLPPSIHQPYSLIVSSVVIQIIPGAYRAFCIQIIWPVDETDRWPLTKIPQPPSPPHTHTHTVWRLRPSFRWQEIRLSKFPSATCNTSRESWCWHATGWGRGRGVGGGGRA